MKNKSVKELKQMHIDLFKIEVEVMNNGKLPFKAHLTDAGFDLFATEDIVFKFSEPQKHPLNIRMALPKGSYATITSKSGLGSKGLLVYAGVIDQSYRGIPHVVAVNLNKDQDIVIKKGQKLAQLIMNPYNTNYYMEEVDSVDTNTDRGTGGFGSTGI